MMIFRTTTALLCVAWMVLAYAQPVQASFEIPEEGELTLFVYPSSAPNFFGSPSWDAYVTNGMFALQNGLMAVGYRDTDPTAYLAYSDGTVINGGNAMVTSFNSWIGQSNPTAPFDNELGNRVHFGLHAFGDGVLQFTLADVQYELVSSDGNLLGVTGDLAGTTFNGTTRIGVDWGPDRIAGTADDIYYTANEDDSTLVDELFYIGVGNGYWPADDQAILDTYAWIAANEPLTFTGAYTILGQSANASVILDPTPIPEPATIALIGLGSAVMFMRGRRSDKV